MNYETVFTEDVHNRASAHLLRHVRLGKSQEDLCFALWRPSTSIDRTTAIIFDIVLPTGDDRIFGKNTSFNSGYLARAVRLAVEKGAGLAFMHNHLSDGWQDLSETDIIAERDRIAPVARATNLPLVGLTLGTDQSWSARFWIWDKEVFDLYSCRKVRVVGRTFSVTYKYRQSVKQQDFLQRTINTWGEICQRDIAGLHFGIVGVGSVGSVIAETLARIGVEKITLIDPDKIESHNLDRLLHATEEDIGKHKSDFVALSVSSSATAANFNIRSFAIPIQDDEAFTAALGCDILFSAVDRPLPKDLLNHVAYAHCIPLVSGGVLIQNKSDGTLGQAAWSVTVAGPSYRCLRCDGQYTSSDVVLDADGSLDDPVYIQNMSPTDEEPRNQNVFPFSANLATSMVIEMIRLVIADSWWPDRGGRQHYSMIPNRLEVEKQECNINCSIKELTSFGDRFKYPFLQKTAGEDSV